MPYVLAYISASYDALVPWCDMCLQFGVWCFGVTCVVFTAA
jgi:hypothetical protein